MSVILDALHKARTDRRKNQSEPHPNSVARVLEPVVAPLEGQRVEKQRSGSGWVLPVTIMFGLLCLVVLVGGAFFLLYDQMRRMEADNTQARVNSAMAMKENNQSTLPEVPPAAMVTPLPLSELPVQTPAPAAAVAALAAPAVAPTVAAKADFKLGSIVCEANDCIANLNGRSVHVGDRVREYQVIEISPSSVTLQGATGGDVIHLSLFD